MVSIVKQKGFPMKNAFRETVRTGIFPEDYDAGKRTGRSLYKTCKKQFLSRSQGPQQEVAWQGCVATLDIPRREEKDEEDPRNSHHAMYSVTYTIRIFPSLKPNTFQISRRIIQ
jgi:hypothetical protein